MSVPSALAAVPRFRACIGLGGNLGDVRAHLRAAESVGVLDPGAVSMSIILRTAAQHIS